MNSTTNAVSEHYRPEVWGCCGVGRILRHRPGIDEVVFVVLVFATGLGILLYIILALVTPSGTLPPKPTGTSGGSGGASGQPGSQSTSGPPASPAP